jgi:hypothetical protein
MDFSSAFSSVAGDWSLSSLFVPGRAWLALIGAAVFAGILAGLFVSRRGPKAGEGADAYTTLAGDSRREVLAVYRGMVALLVRKGLPPRQPAQTPREYAGLVAPRLVEGMGIVRWLTQATDAAAYDSRPLSPSLAREARDKLALLPAALAVKAG